MLRYMWNIIESIIKKIKLIIILKHIYIMISAKKNDENVCMSTI